MPNVLDAEPMRAFVRRVGGKIGDEKIAARFETLAFERLLEDPRNFRPASPLELDAGPDWARKAKARGEEVSAFALSRGASARLHNVARRLADTCKVAATDETVRPADAATIAAARGFLDKFNRANFEIAARKALYFSRRLASWASDGDAEPVCAAQTIAARRGLTWERITSVSELRAVGREFRNCLARTTRAGGYGGMLRHGLAQFWVLRDGVGAGLIVAMADAPAASRFTEVRGPRNAPIFAEHEDLARLAVAIGIPPSDPPPPPPPAPGADRLAQQRRQASRLEAALARLAHVAH